MSQPQFSLEPNLSVPPEKRVTYFGLTDSRNKRTPFGIKKEDRTRHTYVIGKTGMGKSTLLENMAIQDIKNGEGMCFIDPHGGTAEKLLDFIPEDRIKDVLYFAPHDLQYPISFNVLENVDADKRHFVVAGLMSTFEKIWVDAWSARMAYILQNTLAALLEFPGATLLGVNRMYIDKEYRKNVIAKITDPSVRSFWVDEYSKYTDRYTQEATPAIQNKIGQFASNALVRNIIGQEQSTFDIRKLMDERKIFIVNLSKGRMGEGNANLLGSMLITKMYLAAMSRADSSGAVLKALPDFYLYVDEFQNFANKSFADILSEARKYKLCLTITHQYIEQMEDEVRAAVFGNVGTMMTFRVGAYDADVLEKEFAPVFTADDLVNLGQRQIYLKLMIDGVSSQPFSAVTMPPIEAEAVSHRDRAIAYSRAQFSRPRAEVEADIGGWVGKRYEDPEGPEKERARTERRAERATAPPQSSNDVRPRTATQVPSRPSPLPTHTPRQTPEGQNAPRDTPRRPPVGGARPPERKPVERNSDELRSMLARIASPQPPRTGEHGVREEQNSRPMQNKENPIRSIAPVRNDGKGVTDEGKAELRTLLTTLTNNTPPATNGTVRTPTVTQQPTHQPRVSTGITPPPALDDDEYAERHLSPSTTKGSTTPPELSEQELRTMLHVDKPNLE